MPERGKYIVIEGTDGTGKSTQADLIANRLQDQGREVVRFNEPDGVEIAGKIRDVIKNGDLDRSAFTNLLLFSASRHENWTQEGKAALEAGKWIVSSRDYTSTLAYQGYGEGVDLEAIRYLTELSTDETYMTPDHTIILDIDDEIERKRRIAARGELANPDTFESKNDEFQQRVINGYRAIAEEKGLPVISASQPIELIHEKIWQLVIRGSHSRARARS